MKQHDILQDVLLSSETNEWYTPPKYVDLARVLMGHIDLDPASCQFANDNYVKAGKIYTVADNGLKRNWHGNVWLNPPYGKTGNRSNQEIWALKAIYEVKNGLALQAVILLKAAIGYNWFDRLAMQYPMCIKTGLIKFIKPDGTTGGKAKLGTAFMYLPGGYGYGQAEFRHVFKDIGWFNF